ncbi:site-specific integrase [Rhodococcus sp. BP-252]|uniref:tyrosine-type recombinase/integrase n=1 Tax=unclassified Rhodococcus (in: high G+C Gram-positive bacteria) TaxID=192944 RepID=UPI001C9ACB88|nr:MULTISPECIES: tyrosine-type recombinase/integrase [unclassified Rhodococcus (in: high G+C Gram-positive bacteria)]MBY6412894.1 site-specific integrase [Rhodococcus sp. BP-320]MBY6417569.1 site-specific integrase [Rhodococcus sp. BP-321]MBY6423059.1 site-specific integrase [Rhodococcus sp. BP-324]MBY6427593.1 site-specific integrase [Rhodococcus sp. BP-323]MBY6432757.1 site-specific integrase [Rhodococcus sp. BP-322]
MSELYDYWILQKSKTVAPQTITGYNQAWRAHCSRPMGEILIREVTTGKIDSLISDITERTPSGARVARIILSGMLGTAVRFDFMDHNPVREVPRPTIKKSAVRALTPAELDELRSRIRRYCRHETIGDDGTVRPKLGPRPGADLEDILMLLLATGARISEVLALTWSQLDLESAVPRITIDATLVVPRAAGERLIRQDYRKGESPPLTLVLPEFAAAGLRVRQANQVQINPSNAVFVTATGNWVSPANIRRSWRAARGADFDWVKPHTLRKTVATLVKETYGVEAAQMQLGHANTRVTEAHYIQRVTVAPDLTRALDSLAPKG